MVSKNNLPFITTARDTTRHKEGSRFAQRFYGVQQKCGRAGFSGRGDGGNVCGGSDYRVMRARRDARVATSAASTLGGKPRALHRTALKHLRRPRGVHFHVLLVCTCHVSATVLCQCSMSFTWPVIIFTQQLTFPRRGHLHHGIIKLAALSNARRYKSLRTRTL